MVSGLIDFSGFNPGAAFSRGVASGSGLVGGIQQGLAAGREEERLVQSNQAEAEQAEIDRQILSMARGAKTAFDIKDPDARDQFLLGRAIKIRDAGGDPSDTLALRELPFEQQNFELQDAINQASSVSELVSKAGRKKFIGTPQRVTEGGKNFLTGVTQNEDGSFSEERIEITGDFVSTLGQTAEEQAATEVSVAEKKEAGKLRAQFKLKPKVAEAVAAATGRGSAIVKAESDNKSNSAAFNVYETSINNLTEALSDTATGPVLGFIPSVTANQQIADGAVAMMGQTLKQVFRSAGEGTFTDADQKALLGLAPTRTDLPAARVAKIKMIDSIVRAKLEQPSGSTQQQEVDQAQVTAPATRIRFDAQGNIIQ